MKTYFDFLKQMENLNECYYLEEEMQEEKNKKDFVKWLEKNTTNKTVDIENIIKYIQHINYNGVVDLKSLQYYVDILDLEFNIEFKNKRQEKDFNFILKNIVFKKVTQNRALKNIIFDISNLDDNELSQVSKLLRGRSTICVSNKYKKICID